MRNLNVRRVFEKNDENLLFTQKTLVRKWALVYFKGPHYVTT